MKFLLGEKQRVLDKYAGLNVRLKRFDKKLIRKKETDFHDTILWHKSTAQVFSLTRGRGDFYELAPDLMRVKKGVASTALALGVILVAKFTAGAWIIIIILPILMAVFYGVKRYYDTVAKQIGSPKPLDLTRNDPPVAVVPLGKWDMVSERALRFEIRLSLEIYAVYMKLPDVNGKDEEGEKKHWTYRHNGLNR